MGRTAECKICKEHVSIHFISNGICENCAKDPNYYMKQDYSRFGTKSSKPVLNNTTIKLRKELV